MQRDVLDGDRKQQGEQTVERLDPALHEALIESVREVAPDLARYAIEFGFGDVYSRPDLDLRSRQLITMAALTVLGAQPQLRLHMRASLRIGVQPEELVELVIQMAVYAGFPAALNAMQTLKDVLQEWGAETPVHRDGSR